MEHFLPLSVEKAILSFWEDLDTPMSLKCFLLFKNREWDQLALCAADPRQYLSSERYWLDASASCLLRKLSSLPTTFDRRKAAVENFWKAEGRCYRSNERFSPLLYGGNLADDGGGRLAEYFSRVRKKIASILGPVPNILDGRFGPGSTFVDRGRLTTIPDKLSSVPAFTPGAWVFLQQWSKTLWASAQRASGQVPQSVRGNRFLTVPKDCRKDRGICVEPSLNVFYQLGFGRVIRDRLKRWGLDLNKGQDKHRLSAMAASTEGSSCTLDLSNASDTICYNLVKLLLPPSWFHQLDSLRSEFTLIDGKWTKLEKFSSMGNGFTFELETLIFSSLISCLNEDWVPGRDFLVFGDDIIVPSPWSRAVISCLEYSGFEINEEKSFVDSEFRESCGGDFFKGVDVRPFYLKDSPDEPQQLISFANGLRRSAGSWPGRSYAIYRARREVLAGLPLAIRRCRGPSDLGDVVVHDDPEWWQTRRRHGIRYVRCYRPAMFRKVSWSNFRPDVVLAARIYISDSSVDGGLTPRNGVTGYKIGWVPYS